MTIGIGIDTGGTYTDAVAFDFAEARILAKAHTTKEDLSLGILNALDRLPKGAVDQAKRVVLCLGAVCEREGSWSGFWPT